MRKILFAVIMAVMLLAPSAWAKDHYYIVESNGETINSIATAFQLNPSLVASNNWLNQTEKLQKGTEVYLYSDNEAEQPRKNGKIDYDANVTAGVFENVGGDKGNKGHYYGAELRVWPWKTSVGSQQIAIGGFVKGTVVEGSSDGSTNGKRWESKYDSQELDFGPSFKMYWDNRDLTLNVGYFQLWNSDKNMKQDTQGIFFTGIYDDKQRRVAGEKWFPKYDVVGSVRAPFSGTKTSNKGVNMTPDNKFTASLQWTQGVYDLGVTDSFWITPGFFLGGGYSATNPFGRIGIGAEFNLWNKEIAFLGVGLKYTSGVSAPLLGVDANLYVGKIAQAVRAHSIKLASKEEIDKRKEE